MLTSCHYTLLCLLSIFATAWKTGVWPLSDFQTNQTGTTQFPDSVDALIPSASEKIRSVGHLGWIFTSGSADQFSYWYINDKCVYQCCLRTWFVAVSNPHVMPNLHLLQSSKHQYCMYVCIIIISLIPSKCLRRFFTLTRIKVLRKLWYWWVLLLYLSWKWSNLLFFKGTLRDFIVF